MNHNLSDSREQFRKTINHVQADRIVVDLGSTGVTGIHALAVERLRAHLGLEKRPVRIIEPYQMLGEVEADLADCLGIDIIGAWGRKNMFGFSNLQPFREWRSPWGQIVMVPDEFQVTTRTNGDIAIYPEGDTGVDPSGLMPATGYFFDALIRQQPIREDMLDPADNLEEFGRVSEKDLAYWEKEVNRVWQSGKPVVATFGGTALGDIALVPGLQLRHPKGIRDIAEWYISTITRTDYIRTVFEQQIEIAIENLEKIHLLVKDKVDVVFLCGTDFGTQNSTFCAPEQFDDLWLPYYKRLNDWIHSHTEWKTFKHSCGAVETFLSHFIEAGFDIINPVQVNAKGMDPRILKERYGHDLVFWGGGVDTQKILPFGSQQQVREQVLNACEIFSRDGGFVFNTVHNIQANVPVENIIAMFDAIREFNTR